MSIADALAYLCVAAAAGLLLAIQIAAYHGQGRRWFFELLALAISLAGLASLQFPGRGAFVFNILAISLIPAIGLWSGVIALTGRFVRSKRSNLQI